MAVQGAATGQVLDVLESDDAPPLTVVTGRPGTGRTTVLRSVGDALRAQGRAVAHVRLTRDGVPVVTHHDEGARASPNPGIYDLVDGAHADPQAAQRAGAAIAAMLAGRSLVVLLDDAQWMETDGVAVVEALTRRLAGTGTRFVCSFTTPLPAALTEAAVPALRRLRSAGLCATVRVGALPSDESARMVHSVLGAVPAAEVLDLVRDRSRSVAAAIVDVTSSLHTSGGVRLVSGHAYLAPDVSVVPADSSAPSLIEGVRRLGGRSWETAQVAAALEPAGPVLPALLASALETDDADATARLQELRSAGVLHHGRDGGWRFLVPVLGDGLRATLGPFERRRLASILATAAWRGDADLAGPELADLVAAAGRLLPATEAYRELAAAGHRSLGGSPRRAARWWSAAIDLAADPGQRRQARLQYATACLLAGDAAATVDAARALLADADALQVDVRDAVSFMLVVSLHKSGQAEALDVIAEGGAPWQTDDVVTSVSTVMALALRGRWGRGQELLARTADVWSARPTPRSAGEIFQWIGALFAGRLDRSAGALADHVRELGSDTDPTGRARLDGSVACLLALGDVRGVHELAAQSGVAETGLLAPHRAVLALLEGRAEGAEMARRALVDGGPPGFEPGRAILYQTLAVLTTCAGKLTHARRLTAAARAEAPVLDHLIDVPDAAIDLLLGETETARDRLARGLERARANGLVVGTDTVLALQVEMARIEGDADTARERADDLHATAEMLNSPRAAMYAHFGRALAHDDPAAATECLHLARENGQEFEVAHLGFRLAGADLVAPGLLQEIYEFYGRLDALLARSWTRTTMERRGVTVPGRATTKAENESLLGHLLTEGLSNRQIATLLASTEKSVEGRLGRLFARTGHRSRIELAAALIDGGHPSSPGER